MLLHNTPSPLKHLAEFERELKNYKPNLELLDLLHTTKLVVVSGPTASGRNTIINRLIMTGKYYFLVSDTTRRPRINNGIPEKNGEEYWFKSEEEVLHGLKNGAYIEPAIIHKQQVSGMPLSELRIASQQGRIAITDAEIQGCDSIKSYSDTAIPVFVLPPDFPEWMRRLDSRGDMAADEKIRRLTSAINEIETALSRSYFKFIINWDLRRTVEVLHENILANKFNEEEQVHAHDHAKQLLQDIAKYLR